MLNGVSAGQGTSLEELRKQTEAAKKRKEEAELNKTKASADAETAVSSKEAAQVVKKNADAKVESIKAEIVSAENNLVSKQNNYNTINSSYLTAITVLGTLKSANPADENAIASQETLVQNLFRDMQSAMKEIEEAKKVLEQKKADLEKAELEAEEAQNKLEEAEQAIIDANAKLEECEQELETSETELTNANNAVEEAEALQSADETEFVPMTEAEAIDAGYTVIKSVDDLKNIGANLNGKYILMCDIDLKGIDWTPIGDTKSPFKGEFNGNGFDISNLIINNDTADLENIGFFGVTENADIKNVNLVNAQITTPNDFLTGSGSVGILAGTARGTAFDNITVSGDVVGFESVGGLVGTINDNDYIKENGITVIINNSSINNVHTDVNVESSYYAAGMVGYVADTSTCEKVATKFMTISNCTTSGDISVSEESAGGFIGEAGKTIITMENCSSTTSLTWNNTEDDSDLSFLMETGRIGGVIGCANGTFLTLVGCEFDGNIQAEGDFQGKDYGWYMNDAQITIYEIPGGLPIDDILKIEGVDALVPSYNDNGIPHYEVTVSTLTGLDKMVTMIQAKPSLADLVTFNVNFDFEYMDGMYDPSVYSQYGIVQHLYEDENGTVQNDVYIDNEIDLETTFHFQESQETIPVPCENCIKLDRTMVFGLYKDENGSYVVNTFEGTKKVDLKFNADNQTTDVTKRLTSSEVKYRDYITSMVKYYQKVARQALKELFSFKEDDELPVINKAQYKKLLKKAEKLGGIDKLSTADQLAIAVYEVDYKVMNLVAETTHNKGCGMGGEASFLAETTTYQMYAADGRALYTTLNGDSLVQKADDDGNPILDEFGEPIYEYADGSGDYAGFAEIFEQRAYQSQDEEGHLLFADADGNTVVQIKDEDGNTKYVNSDGNELEITESKDENGSVKFTYTDEEGNEQSLERQLTKYDNSSEFNNLKGEMNDLVNDVKNGKYPQGRTSAENENIVVESEKTENSVNDDLVIPSEDIIVTDDIDKQEEKDEMAI